MDQLEFDHIERTGKVMNLSRMNTASDLRFWAEVAKCRLLCRSCHITKSKAVGDYVNLTIEGPAHGLTGYKRRKCRCDVCCAAKAAENLRRPSRASAGRAGARPGG